MADRYEDVGGAYNEKKVDLGTTHDGVSDYAPAVVDEGLGWGEDADNGAQIVRPMSTWAISHAPAANTQATISQAAGGSGVKNVCTAILVTFVGNTSLAAAATVVINLRDGATGAGTVLWSGGMSLPAVAGQGSAPIQLSGLWIEGSDNTAMTIESAAAGGANTLISVNAIGTTILA